MIGDDDVVHTRFNQLELLQGARDEQAWTLLVSYLDSQEYLEAQPDIWRNAARIFFELRRHGGTVRSPIDCCIAQPALEHDALLVHRDQDFETIANVRALRLSAKLDRVSPRQCEVSLLLVLSNCQLKPKSPIKMGGARHGLKQCCRPCTRIGTVLPRPPRGLRVTNG